jgi:signal transduction histidine kinase
VSPTKEKNTSATGNHNHLNALVTRYDRLLEMTSELVSTLELSTLLQMIVDAAKELTDSQAAALLLYNTQRNQLYFEAATVPLRSDDTLIAIPPVNSVAGWIFTRREPLLVSDAPEDSQFFREIDLITSFHTESILGVPLRTKEKTIGVIEAVNKLEGTFTEQDIHVLNALAAQAAIAIENTRLFKQSDIVAEMVHELRTPLSALSAAVHLLQRPELEQEQRSRIRQTIINEVQRLDELTTNFLELSRLESGRIRFEREPVLLEGLVRECIEIMRLQADSVGVLLETDIDRTLSPLMGDRNQLNRLLMNLITNGIKYNHKGGWVRISVQRKDDDALLIVSDNGKGISAENIPNLFKRFYRVPDQEGLISGTGLGLAIAKRIVENHNVTIEVDRVEGEGTTFKVVLPFSAKEDIALY